MAKSRRDPADDLPTGAPVDDEPQPATAETGPQIFFGLASAPPVQPAPQTAADAARGRQGVAPFCPYHKDRQAISYHSNPWLTYYKCPVEGCVFRVKLSRPQRPGPRPAEPEEDFSAR